MNEVVHAVINSIEKVLGAVFTPEKHTWQRYSQATQIIAELESRGWEIQHRTKGTTK